MQGNITHLVDDAQCAQTIRERRWPAGVPCPPCASTQVIQRGFDDTESARQRYSGLRLNSLQTQSRVSRQARSC
jgi:hypothetical protein